MAIEIGDITYQGKLLALMVQDNNFLRTYYHATLPGWFEDDVLRDICTAILEYYKKYYQAPSYDALLVYLRRFIAKTQEQSDGFEQVIKDLKVLGGSDLEFVRDHFIEFASLQAYKGMLWNVQDALASGRLADVPKILRDVQKEVVKPEERIVYPKDIYRVLSDKTIRETIPTGLPLLDNALEGGTAKKELTTILGITSIGKTMFLVNMGVAALKAGKRVLHLFVEESQEKVAMRYAMCMQRKTRKQLQRKPKVNTYYLKQKFAHEDQLVIADCTRWQVDYIRSYIYKTYEDTVPDAVIIDYADKLISRERYSEYRHELRRIYDDLVTIGKSLDIAVWTASQTSKLAKNQKNVDIDASEEGFNKMMAADNVFALQQTEDEAKKNEMRVFTAKVRGAPSRDEIPCLVVRDKMVIMDRSQVPVGLP